MDSVARRGKREEYTARDLGWKFLPVGIHSYRILRGDSRLVMLQPLVALIDRNSKSPGYTVFKCSLIYITGVLWFWFQQVLLVPLVK